MAQVEQAITAPRDEAAEILLDAWRDFIPKEEDEAAKWFDSVWTALDRGWGQEAESKDWKADFLRESEHPATQRRRVAAAVASLPRLEGDPEEDTLDQMNNELLHRGKPMQEDEASAGAELEDKAPHIVVIEEDPAREPAGKPPARAKPVDRPGRLDLEECPAHPGSWHKTGAPCSACTEVKKEKKKESKKDTSAEVLKLLAKQLRKRGRESDSSDDSGPGSESDSEPEPGTEAGQTPKAVMQHVLDTMMTDGMLKARLRPTDGNEFMPLAFNEKLMRNVAIVKKLRKLAKKNDAVALVEARVLGEEMARNEKMLELLERGLDDARGLEAATEVVALAMQRRLGSQEAHKDWDRAEKMMRRKNRAQLTQMALENSSAGGQASQWDQ